MKTHKRKMVIIYGGAVIANSLCGIAGKKTRFPRFVTCKRCLKKMKAEGKR